MPIRTATERDRVGIASCARNAYDKYVSRMGREPAPMIADFDTQIREELVWVEEQGARLRGFIVQYPRCDHLHVENVAVEPAEQGKNIGLSLMQFAERTARERGIDAIELYTNEKMVENFGFYRRLGYRETGRAEEDGFRRVYYRKDGLLSG